MDNIENTPETPEVPQLSEIEQRAMEMGWRPKSEFHGDEVDFIEAKEYVNRKPLFDKIEHQSRQLKQVTTALNALKTHYTKVQETEFNRALAALKEERRTALRDGDGDKFDTVDEQIKTVETQIKEVQQAAQIETTTNEVPQVFNDWVSRNSWYTSSKAMKAYADEVGRELAGTMEPTEVLKQVEKSVRKEFAHKFVNPNKEIAPEVGSSRGTNSRTRSESFELTDQERHIMNTLIKSDPVKFTKEKYIADLKKIKGLE